MHFFFSPFNFVFVEQQAEKPIAQRILFRLTLYLKLAMTLYSAIFEIPRYFTSFLKKNAKIEFQSLACLNEQTEASFCQFGEESL
jgi:hypothetical protein